MNTEFPIISLLLIPQKLIACCIFLLQQIPRTLKKIKPGIKWLDLAIRFLFYLLRFSCETWRLQLNTLNKQGLYVLFFPILLLAFSADNSLDQAKLKALSYEGSEHRGEIINLNIDGLYFQLVSFKFGNQDCYLQNVYLLETSNDKFYGMTNYVRSYRGSVIFEFLQNLIQPGSKAKGSDPIPTPRMTIFPNPVHSELNIRLYGYEGATILSLTDPMGRMVWQKPLEAEEHFLKINLADAGISNGVYWLHLQTENETQTELLFIIR